MGLVFTSITIGEVFVFTLEFPGGIMMTPVLFDVELVVVEFYL